MFNNYENYGAPSDYGMPLVSHPINPPMPTQGPHWKTMEDITAKPNSDIKSKIPYLIVVNSANRNTDQDTSTRSSQNYKVKLRTEINEVVELKMEIADIPKSRYLIHSYNDTLHFQETNAQVSAGTYLTATITHGDYDIADLCSTLETAMETAGSTTYTVSYNETTRKITILQDGSGTDVFNLVFTDGPRINGVAKYPYIAESIGKVIGFRPVNHTGATGASYTSDWVVDLSYGDYIVVQISNFDILDTPIDSGIKSAYCVVYYDNAQGSYRLLNDGRFNAYFIQLKNLQRLGELNIALFDQFGNPYETNGADHSFVFSVRSMMSANYDTER
jgi:hypothetical protein